MDPQSKSVMIKEFFGVPGKLVTMQELKALSSEERAELVELIAREAGATELRGAA